jgi:hypothetical protein
VKEHLFVANLLDIPVSVLSKPEQATLIKGVRAAKAKVLTAQRELANEIRKSELKLLSASAPSTVFLRWRPNLGQGQTSEKRRRLAAPHENREHLNSDDATNTKSGLSLPSKKL